MDAGESSLCLSAANRKCGARLALPAFIGISQRSLQGSVGTAFCPFLFSLATFDGFGSPETNGHRSCKYSQYGSFLDALGTGITVCGAAGSFKSKMGGRRRKDQIHTLYM
ncbi:uncharacterized protein GLRG_10474 [Colletotrichum graminicola M1.001]|uniref:Uncharacterized protein n=1 Tax=Colletotrichum graminicola (strain M1.001 / M2 / FGSC 10212) TaxID=645133 RepID=E3QWU2_COLGM|nr:uncharacterized protein GLRG_10474 [Colletotrichum graminicola M1.001]EFQ35330.1 hypothetical protein GLRG_10474 [Colletotrichum graminicola M1.001]